MVGIYEQRRSMDKIQRWQKQGFDNPGSEIYAAGKHRDSARSEQN
jgi:hypothetical protein